MRNIIIVLLLTLGATSMIKAQSTELKKTINSADDKFEFHDYYGAAKLYLEAYEQDSANTTVNFRLGVCKYEMKEYKNAERYFIKSSSAVSLEIFRYKAAIAHAGKKFKKAINYYNAYKIINGKKDLTNEEVNYLISKSIYAQNVIKSPRNVSIINIGSNINSKHDEYVPLISADEEIMIYTSRNPKSTGGLLDPNGRFFEDIYSSTNIGNVWQKPTQLRQGINTNTNDASAGLSADGNLLFIFRTNEDLISGDLYESRMGLDDWEDPVKMSSNINSSDIEASASIVPNERILYFSSNREGGFGGKDIYKVERLPNGDWGKVQNLGPTINTANDEDAPFIHSDGKTLYFSSTGHQNMGGYDIFKTELNESDEWSNPENLGYPINSVTDDIFFVLAADGKSGYYSSSREGGYGGQDIYKVLLKDEYEKLTVLKGVVYADNEESPLSAKITLIEVESASIQGIYKSKDGTGKFIMLVEPGKTYNYVIQSDGYHPKTDELLFDIKSTEVIKFNLEPKN